MVGAQSALPDRAVLVRGAAVSEGRVRVEYAVTHDAGMVLVRLRGTPADCLVFAGAVERRALETEGVARVACSQRTPTREGCELRLWCAGPATTARVFAMATRVLSAGSPPPSPLRVVT